jgi:PAS domain S-box-containing protein
LIDQERRLAYVVFDLRKGRVRTSANLAAVCGFELGMADADIPTFLAAFRERLSISDQTHIDSAREAFRAGVTTGEGEFSVSGDDSVARRIECFWSVERDAKGRPKQAIVCGVDADPARRMEGAFRDLEARHGSALKAGRMGSWETDLVAKTRTWSSEGMALFGLELARGEGRVGGPDDEYVRAIHPDDRHLVRQYYDSADAQDSFPAEYRIVRSDGATIWLAGRGLVLSRGPDGKAQRLVSIMADISERRAAEENLRVERERLVLALGAGRMGAFDLDIDRDLLWWSPKMFEVFGVTPETFVPSRDSVARLIHPDDFKEFAHRRSEAIAQRHPFEIEARIIRPDGSTGWVAHRGHSTYDSAGRPRRSFGVTMDIGERKAAELALRDADRLKDDFIATLAHELRNPLAPIRNAISLLRQHAPADDPQGARYRDVLSRQIAQMSRLLDDLLDVSRIGRGQVRLRIERFDLRSLFDHAIEIAQPSIEAAGHTLEVVVPTVAIEMDGDLLRLAQVLSNLLINAAKYTPSGGQIRVSGVREGDEVLLRVQDNGVGIASDQMARIFEMFGQAESAHQRTQGGLGIGLALARGLVELHGGRLEASSDGPGTGSVFAVRLPVAIREGASIASLAVDDPSASHGPGGDALRVLVADDLVDNAVTMAEILRIMGHDVKVVHDGVEALRVASTFHPDVALLDLGMPGMSGFEVAREIRRHDWGTSMTLICQTGWGQDKDRMESLRAGFDHHLVKPIDLADVVRVFPRR